MNTAPILERSSQSIAVPPKVPAQSIIGQKGKVIRQISNKTGARVNYIPEDHRLDISGRPRTVEAAARLVEKTIEHFQYSGLQFANKEIVNLLSPELSTAGTGIQLLPVSRPVVTITGSYDGFVLDPASPSAPLPDPASLAAPPASPRSLPLVHPWTEREAAIQRLLDLAVTIALEHPAHLERLELRMYLGKLVLMDVRSSVRTLPVEALMEWTYPTAARAVFETSLPQDTIRSLDRYLSSIGLAASHQSKSASIHLETSIPWIQYHPTFAVEPDGSLRLAKLETLGCKPITLAMVGRASQLDARLRFVASAEHRPDDPVAAELRRKVARGEFALVNSAKVTVPEDLLSLDLTLTSARVKLKRVYSCSGPLPPPAAPAAPATAPATPAKRTRRKRASASDSASASSDGGDPATAAAALPAVSLKVSVAAVVDNLGGKRLEVTAVCPELNATLRELHERRRDEPGVRERLAAQLRSLMQHVEGIQQNVAFEP